jgi:serine/threonine protein kinase
MAFTPSQGAEPIPGYRLIEKLGSGGFGEVWKASAPGDLLKAIKIVYGNMEDQRAEQELKALRRVKEVRHPFLLSLERIEVQDGQLIIVTELADGSLMERYLNCRRTGLPGIPRDELLSYLRDAADALDYMGSTRDLQHLDVKPQNLLLVAGRIKVADFGLVKDLAVSTVSAAGGATPVYASPEAFDGRASRASDQYSLAIVYQEMLTGTRPFHGESTLQLAMQHVHGRPHLNALPASDRQIIARSLSKVPDERYASCRELIDSLERAKETPAGAAGPSGAPTSVSMPNWVPANLLNPSLSPPVVSAAPPVSAPPLGVSWPLPKDNPLSPPPSIRPSVIGLMPASIENLSLLVSTVIRKDMHAALPLDELSGDTVAGQGGPQSETVRPTLFIGLGGLAGTALRRLRRRFFDRFGEPLDYPFFPMLLIDVDRVALRRAMKGDPREALLPSETILTPLHPPEHYRDKSRELLRWLDRRWLYGIPRSLRTDGLRPLGRLAFVDNAVQIQNRLTEELTKLTGPALRTSVQKRGITLRAEAPRVVIAASISGGTGSGMLSDMAYLVRQAADDLDLTPESICGILLYTTGQKPAQREMSQINSAATMAELTHFSGKESIYPGDAEHGLRPCGPGQRPFDDCYFIHLGDQLDRAGAEAATDRAAEYLALDCTPHGGPALEHFRKQSRQAEGFALHVFGLQRLGTTRDLLGERAAATLCRQVVGLWTGGMTIEETAAVDTQAERLATSLALDLPALMHRFEAAATEFSGGDPLAPVQPDLVRSLAEFEAGGDGVAGPGATQQVLAKLDEYLGGMDSANAGARESLLKELRRHVRGAVNQVCESLAHWLRKIVDSPGERLAAADRAAEWFAHFIDEQITASAVRLDAVRVDREYLKAKHLAETGGATRRLGGLLGRGKKRDITDLASNPLTHYCRLRLEEFLLDHAGSMLTELGHIVSHLRQELSACRQEIKALGSAIVNFSKGPPLDDLAVHAGLTWLVPGNLPNLLSAEQALLSSMGINYARHVDQLVQQEILDAFGGLWAVASSAFGPAGGHGAAVEQLQKAIAARARRAANALLTNFDSASLLRESSGSEEAAWESLSAHIIAARPPAAAPDQPQLLLIALPTSSAGEALRERVLRMSGGGNVQVTASAGDILVCHETSRVAALPALIGLSENSVSWGPLAARVSTRTDVAWTGISCSAV